MSAVGFTAVRFSQSRATHQTLGIPDRRFYCPARRVAVWWEAKTEVGHPSAGQLAFRAMCEACGEDYVIGTDGALTDWLVARGIVGRVSSGLRVLPFSVARVGA